MRCMADKAVASQFSRRLLAPRRRPQRLPARYAADSEIGVRPLRKIEAELVHRRSRSVTQDARSSAAINLKRKRGRCDATALRDDERPRRRGTTERQQVLNENLRRFNQYVVALREVAAPEHLGALLDGTGLPARISRRCSPTVATRWPHRVVEVLDQRLADAPDVPWCTLAAALTLPDLGDLLVIATTSSWRLDAEAARERQALALADLDARHRRTLPTIIAGDLNAGPDLGDPAPWARKTPKVTEVHRNDRETRSDQ